MRVIGGSARGMKLSVVPGEGTRPILDRVKTALCDILRPTIDEIRFLDLFAGSGSVGIEALSQGAAWCTLIERRRLAIQVIRKNLETTGLTNRSEVRQADAFAYLKEAQQGFDLIYIAPPQYQGIWERAMAEVDARPQLIRSQSTVTEPLAFPGLVVVQIDPKDQTVETP